MTFNGGVYLLTAAGWTQNRGLNGEGSVEGRRFDPHGGLLLSLRQLAYWSFIDHPLGSEVHLEFTLYTYTRNYAFNDGLYSPEAVVI